MPKGFTLRKCHKSATIITTRLTGENYDKSTKRFILWLRSII